MFFLIKSLLNKHSRGLTLLPVRIIIKYKVLELPRTNSSTDPWMFCQFVLYRFDPMGSRAVGQKQGWMDGVAQGGGGGAPDLIMYFSPQYAVILFRCLAFVISFTMAVGLTQAV